VFVRLDKERGYVLISIESFFDGSYAGKDWLNGSFVTLAGLAPTDSIWREFDKGWAAILDDNRDRPKAPYLHMNELAHLGGAFGFEIGMEP